MTVSLLLLFVFISSTYCATQCYQTLNFTSEKGRLWVNNDPFVLKGLSWFGFETPNNVFHGLWARDYKDLLDFIQKNGFNAMRIPYYLELMLHDATPQSINFYQMNEDLQNLTSLQVLDKVVTAAAERGITIMFDMHSFLGGSFMADGLWYDATHPESMVLQTWDALIARYAKNWNVIALDLKNEPWATTWGTGAISTDWNLAAERIGDHILSNGGDKFLIFVEGTNKSPACNQSCFWGEDLTGVRTNPVRLSNQKRLVYSPHCYGPSVFDQTYFDDPSFPANMPAIWDDHYGFVPNLTGNCFVVGEWGGQYSGKDQVWLEAYAKYLKNKEQGQFFWCLNPDSGDTGGLLEYDWTTPDTNKLNLLQSLVPNPTIFSQQNGKICVTN